MHLWPEGEKFTREVIMPTGAGIPEEGVEPVGFEDFPVMVTFRVPAFDVVLAGYLYAYPGADENMFRVFCEYVKEVILANQKSFPQISEAIH